MAQESEPLKTDRPDFTEGAWTITPGRIQVEMGYTFSRVGEQDEQDFGELLIRLGILPWLEGRLGLKSFVVLQDPTADRSGLDDLTIGFKVRLHRQSEGSSAAIPRVTLGVGAALPTGASEIGSSEVVPGTKVTAGWDLSDRFSVGSNVGWLYGYAEGERFHQGIASVVLGYSLSDPLTGYVEWYGLFPENPGGGSGNYVDGGLAWLLNPNLQIDWRIGAGLQDPSPNWFTGVGLSFRL